MSHEESHIECVRRHIEEAERKSGVRYLRAVGGGYIHCELPLGSALVWPTPCEEDRARAVGLTPLAYSSAVNCLASDLGIESVSVHARDGRVVRFVWQH